MRAVIAIVLAALVSSVAHADDEIAKGSIVKIEAQEIYVDIGAQKGVAHGQSVRIKRGVSLRHPVTRELVQDWIPIGSASVTQAGSVMSRAVLGDLVTQVKLGDVVEILVDRPDIAPGPDRPTPPRVTEATGDARSAVAVVPPQGPPVDPQTAEVLGVFAAQAGQSLEVRIASWERFLSARSGSPFAAAIRRDLDQLHALRDELRPRDSAEHSGTIVTVGHEAPKTAVAGEQIPVVFVLDDPQQVASAYLHYRPRGNRTYRSMLLVREHDIYLRGTLPAEVVKTPGLDYFVEVSTPDGRSGLALGTPREPIAVDVKAPTMLDHFGSVPGRSSVKIAADYLDFATFDERSGDHTDHQLTANVDFTYRLDSHIESVGVGYGVYAGSGGFANTEWTDAMPIQRSGFHYGYADIEVGGTTDGVHLAAGGQLIAGVGKEGFGLGAEGRFRIGDRDGTNLAFIGRTVEQVGFLSDIRLGTRPADKLLLGISVGATNQPTKGDVGVKLATEVEILAIENVSLILRGSWQGRTTAHGGIGGGGGLGFYW